MISLTTSGSPAETAAAYGLLSIIADPDAAKARLDALVVEKKAAEDAMNVARQALDETEKNKTSAAADLAEAIKVKDAATADFETRAKQLADQDAFLAAKDARLAEYETKVSDREHDLASREEAVQVREKDVTAREAAVRETSIDAQLLKEEYQRKVSALRSALDPGPVNYKMQAETGALGAPMGEAR